MRIASLRWTPYAIPFRRPLPTTHRRWDAREGVIIQIEADAGLIGLGDVAPLPEFGTADVPACLRALENVAPRLASVDLMDAMCAFDAVMPNAALAPLRCAIESACVDIEAKAGGRSVAALLADEAAEIVAVNAICADDRDASSAAAAGYRCIKLKVGAATRAEDLARVAAVRRAIGRDVALRLDANGGWSEGEAIAFLHAVAAYDIEFVEQPVVAGQLEAMRRVREDDRLLASLPMFHVGGLAVVLRGVLYGSAVVVQGSFDAARVNEAIEREGATTISVVANMLRRMLDERGDAPYPPSLRTVLLGGGPAPRELLEACARRGVPVLQTYGLTEAASQVATLAPGDALRKLGSAGRPLPGTSISIENDGRACAAGEAGEIVVSGPTVSPGYWQRPDETAAVFRDGRLRTGDFGYLDDEGYLYVLDRRDDLIVSGGENVYPAEVESVLLAHPDVAEAAVYGVPDASWGAVPAAAVVLRDGTATSTDQLIAWCRARLARYKAPSRVAFVDELPRNAAGKVQRRLLRDRTV